MEYKNPLKRVCQASNAYIKPKSLEFFCENLAFVVLEFIYLFVSLAYNCFRKMSHNMHRLCWTFCGKKEMSIQPTHQKL